MTEDRARAYANLMKTLRRLESVGGLLPDEADQIRVGADVLLFSQPEMPAAESFGAVDGALALVEGLVTVGRWPGRMARRTLDALAACGPAAARSVQVPIGRPGQPGNQLGRHAA